MDTLQILRFAFKNLTRLAENMGIPLPPKYNNSMTFTTMLYHVAHMEEEEQ